MRLEVNPARAVVTPKESADLRLSMLPVLNAYMFRAKAMLHKILTAEWPQGHGKRYHRQAMLRVKDKTVSGLTMGHRAQDWPRHFVVALVVQSQKYSDQEAEHLSAAIHWVDRLLLRLRAQSHYVLELAVVKVAQGKGLSKRLLDAGGRRAKAAVRFYRNMGFTVEIEICAPFLQNTQGTGMHCHIVCPLAHRP